MIRRLFLPFSFGLDDFPAGLGFGDAPVALGGADLLGELRVAEEGLPWRAAGLPPPLGFVGTGVALGVLSVDGSSTM